MLFGPSVGDGVADDEEEDVDDDEDDDEEEEDDGGGSAGGVRSVPSTTSGSFGDGVGVGDEVTTSW